LCIFTHTTPLSINIIGGDGINWGDTSCHLPKQQLQGFVIREDNHPPYYLGLITPTRRDEVCKMREEAMTECSYRSYSAVMYNQRTAGLISAARDTPWSQSTCDQPTEGRIIFEWFVELRNGYVQ
jgi:hypothetical protein